LLQAGEEAIPQIQLDGSISFFNSSNCWENQHRSAEGSSRLQVCANSELFRNERTAAVALLTSC
jgi:hypothetical protein